MTSQTISPEPESLSGFFFSIDADIAAINDKEDLTRFLDLELKAMLDLEYSTIFIFNHNKTLLNDFLADEIKKINREPFKRVINIKQLGKDISLQNISPIIDLSQFEEEYGFGNDIWLDDEQIKKIAQANVFPLTNGKDVLGYWVVYFAEQVIPSYGLIEKLKIISGLFSLLIGKIRTEELLLERELLLSISTDIAAVRNSSELLKVINKRFKSLLGFSHTVIGTLNEGQECATLFMRDPYSLSKAHKFYEEAISKQYNITDGVLNVVLESAKPVIINLEELARKTELPLYLKINYESGISQAIVAKFSKGDYVHGFLILFYEEDCIFCKNKLDLIESLANQVSVAVLNIIANEEIKNRENEKSRLLAFSNAIASVSDRTMLSKTLKRQLKDLFDINEYVIHKLNANKTKHTPVLFDPDASFSKHPDFKKMLDTETDVHDGIFDVILASDEPVFFKIDDWTKLPGVPAYANAAAAEDLKTMVGVAIKYGNENIAVMNFKHEDHGRLQQNFSLFKSIISQIAVMVSNIIANDKIINHLAEINNYKQLLEQEKTYLKEEIETAHNYTEIIGESPQMQKVFRLIAQVSHSDSTVLLLGETGTGKEIVARAIHNNSRRKNKLMVKVNCAALPANLIESELFGHERGSFTGATERRLGKFELANGGTLFLDEIGEMPLELQVKLLRVLQEREIERIGGKGIIKVDVRIIAATNRDLETEMDEGRFRSDLYYRLNIFPITLPSLRNRKEDIPLLTTHFISRFGKKAGRNIKAISTKALQDMILYNWPGNIRELEHMVERSILLSEGDMLKTIHLPTQKNAIIMEQEKARFQVRTIDDNERQHILDTLKYCQGRVGGYSGAAELLGVPPSTLFSKMKKLGIKRDVISDNLSQ
jgi:formate hydrogenlyase transcriptional activator